jgi:hypothetical protein
VILETKFAAATGTAVVFAAAAGAVSFIDEYNAVATSTGALIIALVAVIGMLLTNRSNKKRREQDAQIARDTAEALKLQNAAMVKQQEIIEQAREFSARLDGRLTEFMSMYSELAEAAGVKKERKRAADEAAEKATVTAVRDDKIIAVVAAKVADTVVDHVADAIDEAVKTVPTPEPTRP